jgi:arsenate reductase
VFTIHVEVRLLRLLEDIWHQMCFKVIRREPQINQDAVRIMKELYNIDMEAEGQFSKLVSDIPDPDIAISMGCNVGCPFIGRPFDDNWGLEDPTGKSDEEFKIVIEQIKNDILKLKSRLNHNRSSVT